MISRQHKFVFDTASAQVLVCGVLCLAALPLVAQPPNIGPVTPKVALPVQEKVDLTTPALAIKSFVAALNRADFDSAAHCVFEGKPGAVKRLSPMADEWKKNGPTMLIGEPRVQTQFDWAAATVAVKMTGGPQAANAPEQPAQTERVLLRRVDTKWQIAVNPSIFAQGGQGEEAAPAVVVGDQPPGMVLGSGFLTLVATGLANPEVFERARDDAQRFSCLNNLKQVALAVFQMEQDFNAIAMKKAAQKAQADGADGGKADLQPWQKALLPYTKTMAIFACPTFHRQNAAKRGEKKADLFAEDYESYAFNTLLENVKLGHIVEPARTVLFYEGKDGKLDFRHGGKANVAYADGRVKAIKAEEAENLIWQPQLRANAPVDARVFPAQCENNLKQLITGLMQMTIDAGGRYDFDKVIEVNAAAMNQILPINKQRLSERWQLAVWPYVQNELVFLCPQAVVDTQQWDGRANGALPAATSRLWQSYAFNQQLNRVAQDAVAQPSRTVLLYEGKDGKLDFRHDGKTIVAFVDGHVKPIDENEAKQLIWNPKGKVND